MSEYGYFDIGGLQMREEPARDACFKVVRRDTEMHEHEGLGDEARREMVHRHMSNEITSLVEEINWRHGSDDWTPILLLRQYLPLPQVLALYRLAEVCVVSALHDGMNLIAKEYLTAKNDGNGVLVLSRFTGAARELGQALQINPYDTETFADVLAAALEMGEEERANRMRALRDIVERNNIYRWAGKVLTTLASLRSDTNTGLQEADLSAFSLPLLEPE